MVRVYPAGLGREVYRTIEICGDRTLNQLCQVILKAFEFTDELNLRKGQKFSLHYDFGDDWMFTITVSKVSEVSEKAEPCIIKSKGEIQQYPDWDEEDWDDE